ncbi:MAG: carboxylesterase family protein, partial [Myxococcota bacterium]
MVFVHGGGNISGSTTEMQGGFVLYDGARLAARENVIVVTVQYRLGALGYLVDSALDDGAPSGNYGLRDLVAALQWVQRNAAALGGDAERVMLFGESGGGTNVCALLATPSAADLFSSAIVMSGGCAGAERDAVAEWSRDVRTAVQCDGTLGVAECLRAADAESLVRAAGTLSQSGGLIRTPAGPTIDGDFLPKSPRSAFEAGEQSQVPVVFGVTAQETASLLFGIPLVPDYEATVRLLFARSGAADEVLARYPLEDYASPRDALVDLTTDLQFVCPAAFAIACEAN